MNKINTVSEDLIAPCGMNCAVCSRYLSHTNNLKRIKCTGCRARYRTCAYLFKKCGGPETNTTENSSFCFGCGRYPCKQIDRMDKRYRLGYGVSIKENLEYIRKYGVSRFTDEQYRKYHCPKCFGMISIHNRKCFKCDPVTRLVEKLDAEAKGKSGRRVPASRERGSHNSA